MWTVPAFRKDDGDSFSASADAMLVSLCYSSTLIDQRLDISETRAIERDQDSTRAPSREGIFALKTLAAHSPTFLSAEAFEKVMNAH